MADLVLQTRLTIWSAWPGNTEEEERGRVGAGMLFDDCLFKPVQEEQETTDTSYDTISGNIRETFPSLSFGTQDNDCGNVHKVTYTYFTPFTLTCFGASSGTEIPHNINARQDKKSK